MAEFSEKAILASVLKHFADNYSETSNVTYHNTLVDLDSVDDIVEVDITTLTSLPRRKGNKERQLITLHAFCLAKPSTNLYKSREIADAVAAVWNHAFIDILDYDDGSTSVGGLSLFETTIEDRTAEFNDDERTDWNYHVVSVRGVAQEK